MKFQELRKSKAVEKTIVMGNFDGFHKGHMHLISTAKSQADKFGHSLNLVTFNPHPHQYFSRLDHGLLCTHEMKQNLAKEVGFDGIYVIEFDETLASMEPVEFVKNLKEAIQPSSIFVGNNFFYGKARRGSTLTLREDAAKYDMKVAVVDLEVSDHDSISSSLIRGLLVKGEFDRASKLLGREFVYLAKCEKGKAIGREMGFPTMNLQNDHQLMPENGVYAGRVILNPQGFFADVISQKKYKAVINIGHRPSFNFSPKPIIEAHVFDGSFESVQQYGQAIGVVFKKKIREEIKFSSREELMAQIQIDIKEASYV